MNALQMTYKNDLGKEGSDADPANPLARISRRTLGDGHPSRRYALAFIDLSEGDGFGDNVRWIGAFTHTIGERLLCFLSYSGSSAGSIPDHITLERGYRDVHFSYRDGNRKTVGKPHKLANGMYHWFAVGIQDIRVLRELYKETQITVPVPETDAERRMKNFKAAHDPEFPDICVKLDPDATKRFSPGFLYLSVNVGPPGLPNCVYVPSPMEGHIPKLACRIHKLGLSSDYELHINTAWLPGSLADQFMLITHRA